MARLKFLFFAAVLAGFTALAYAGFDDGKTAYDRADTAKAYEELKPLAEQRFAGLQADLGVTYNFGLGSQEYGEAVKFYRGEAELGNIGAQYHLGLMYAKGRGVPQDYIEAAKWYRKAAEQGHADAQHDLGVMYLDGEGVPQDFVQAHMWLDLAAAQGDRKSQQLRDEVAGKMTASEIAEAQRLASERRRKGRD
ncbi:MAG: tetratricopeptide repeat protein [Syntrophobacteraceae bacterium]|jgi:TPR repeat protein